MRFLRGETKLLFAFLLSCLLASVSFGGTVNGTVSNGTTGKPAAGVEVILIRLQGGMEPVSNTRTDASGHYQLSNPQLGTTPMLLRAVYRGVFYFQPATPGRSTINMKVYEPTQKPGAISVTAHAVIVQPTSSGLSVDEEYSINNQTQPPVAYYRQAGSFLFTVPAGAHLGQVSAGEASGLPVIQSTIAKAHNEKAIAYAFRPGESRVGISYTVPYPNNQTQLQFSSPYAVGRFAVFAPPAMQISGDGLAPAGQEQGYNAYLRESVAANTPVTVSIAGTAPPPQSGATGASAGGDAQNPSVNSHIDSGTQVPAATLTELPARISSLKWIVVAGFAVLLAIGLIFLWRQQTQVAPAAADTGGAAPPAPKLAPEPRPTRAEPAPPAPVSPPQNATVASAEREVRGSLDELKDSLFRLELRREAGTITEEEYVRQRDRIQKTLRDLVKG